MKNNVKYPPAVALQDSIMKSKPNHKQHKKISQIGTNISKIETMTSDKRVTDEPGKKIHKAEIQGYADVRMTRAHIGPNSTTPVKCIKYLFVDWVTNSPAKIQYKDGRLTTLMELFLTHKNDFPGVDTVGWNSERVLILRHTPSNTD